MFRALLVALLFVAPCYGATTGPIMKGTYDAGELPHGQFLATANQTVANTTTAYAIAFNAESDKLGLTHDNVTNNSRVQIDSAGDYMIALSIIYDGSAPGQHLDVWMAIGGVNVANSNTRTAIAAASEEAILSVTFIQDFTAGQYFEIMYCGDNTNVRMLTTAAAANPTRPASPAVIMTVNKMSD